MKATHETTALALNTVLPADGTAPDWVELIPPGTDVVGNDGRAWVNDNPQAVIAYFAAMKARNQELPFDWEHSSELKAPKGDEAPAAGWGTDLEVRDKGAIWGKVSWTPRGLTAVANREYRHLSPVIVFEKATRRIVGIASVGLTNKPNLHLQALNQEGPSTNEEEPHMLKSLLAKLALPETATEAEALNAIGKLQGDLATANNRAESPSLDKFVPRADYTLALNRATAAETALAETKKAELETAINTEIDAALKAGKITPATADYHKASCRQEGGLDRFKDFIKAAPTVADASGLDGKDPDKDKGLALNAEQTKIAGMFGNSAEDLKKYGEA